MILLFSLSSIFFSVEYLNDIYLAYHNIFTKFTFDFNIIFTDLGINSYDFIYILVSLIIMCLLKEQKNLSKRTSLELQQLNKLNQEERCLKD